MRLSRRILRYLETHGPVPAEQMARDLDTSPARCREELEWIDGRFHESFTDEFCVDRSDLWSRHMFN